MGTKTNETRPGPERVTVTSTEFRADSNAAIREVVAGKTVTVTDAGGKPRMHILRQTDSLDD